MSLLLALDTGAGVTGTFASSEAADTILVNGTIIVHGTSAISETSPDTILANGKILVKGNSTIIEPSVDTISTNGKVIVTGNSSVSEQNDFITLTGFVTTKGSFGLTESSSDIFSAIGVGKLVSLGTISLSENTDTISSIGKVFVSGAISPTESNDIVSINVKNIISGQIGATELPDVVYIIAKSIVTGYTQIVESVGDTCSASGNAPIIGNFSVQESTTDSINIIVSKPIVAIIGIQETNADIIQLYGYGDSGRKQTLDKSLDRININFLSPIGYVFEIDRLPNITFFVQECDIPDKSLYITEISTPILDYPIIGNKLSYPPLKVSFKIDEKMINYKEILEWMYGINNPESLDNHRLYALSNINKYYNKHISDFLNLFSDGWLHILDNNNNENVVLKFVDMFPVEISEINFSTNKTDVNYITCNITFQYSYIEQIN